MFGWFIGRDLVRNVRKDLAAQKDIQLVCRKFIALQVVRTMHLVDEAGKRGGVPQMLEAARGALHQAQHDKAALASGASSSADYAWHAAALCGSWADAQLASLEGRISAKAIDKVDATIWAFVSSVLTPSEIAQAAKLARPRRALFLGSP